MSFRVRKATSEKLRELIDSAQKTEDYFSSDAFDIDYYGGISNYPFAKRYYMAHLKKSCEEELLRRAVVSEWLS